MAFKLRRSSKYRQTAIKGVINEKSDGANKTNTESYVALLSLFKYALPKERLLIAIGLLLVYYAAAWMPIATDTSFSIIQQIVKFSKKSAALREAESNKAMFEPELIVVYRINVNDSEQIDDQVHKSKYEQIETASKLIVPVLLKIGILNQAQLDLSIDTDSDMAGVKLVEDFLTNCRRIAASFFLIAVSELLALFLGTALIEYVARKQVSRIKILYFKSCLNQELEWFQSSSDSATGSGSSFNALMNKFEDGIGTKLAIFAFFCCNILHFVALGYYLEASFETYCLPFVVFTFMLVYITSQMQARTIGEQTGLAKQSMRIAEEILGAVRTVFAYNGQQKELIRFRRSLNAVFRKSMASHWYSALSAAISKTSTFAWTIVFIYFASQLLPPYNTGPIDLAVVLLVMGGAEGSMLCLIVALPFFEAIQQAKGCVVSIYRTIDDGIMSSKQQCNYLGSKLRPQLSDGITLDKIQFCYRSMNQKLDSQKNTVLEGFSLHIEAGKSIALVGPSGSGKSTVLSLVQKLYNPTTGKILIGTEDISNVNIDWLRENIGVVEQEARLFDMSIADNIKLGLPNEILQTQDDDRIMQQVIEAAREAGADEFIRRLPEGYATRSSSSAGSLLSGGQRQRIAIARVLIRHPKILLLDECTSALDSHTETLVWDTLKRASKGRTTLIVAHKLELVRHVDKIVVMDKGRILGIGTHNELMNSATESAGGCLYRELYNKQVRGLTVESDTVSDRSESSSNNQAPQEKQVVEKKVFEPIGYDQKKKNPADQESCQKVDSEDAGQQEVTSESRADHQGVANRVKSRSYQSSIWQVLKFIEIPPWICLMAIVICIVSGCILPMQCLFIGIMSRTFEMDPADIGDHLQWYGLLRISVSPFVLTITLVEILLSGYLGESIGRRLRIKLMRSLLRKQIYYFDAKQNTVGDICDRVNNNVANLQNITGLRVATLVEALSTITIAFAISIYLQTTYTVFCLFLVSTALITTILENKLDKAEAKHKERIDCSLASLMADSFANIKTIVALNKQNYFLDRYKSIVHGRSSSLTLVRTFSMCLKLMIAALLNGPGLYFGCCLLARGLTNLETIVVLRSMIFLPELLKAYRSASRLYSIAQEHSPEVLCKIPLKQRLELQYDLCGGSSQESSHRKAIESDGPESDYMDLSEEFSTLDTIIPAQMQATGRIKFKGVRFAYPTRSSTKVLDDFNLSISPGESVAIVGASGSGKSSCVGLLEKFYDFQSGRITLDGFDLRMLDSQWVRSQIRLVSQDTTLLSYTIADNIRYGDNNRQVSMQQVQDAAKAANIHDFIMSLPLNYNTELSSSSLGPLSGGQRQRIAIARALIQCSAPILILDEATSALDNCSESAVQEAILRASRNRTTIIVAHRLATVKHADKIVVMKDGHIVESGRHEELLQLADGYYRKLWLKQQSAICESND